MAEIGRLIGAALAGGGIAMVYMQFNQKSDPSVEAQMPDDVKNSRLKKTLTNAGLYPTPGSRLKTQPSGSMAVFASGQPGAALVKGGGEPL